MMDYGKLDAIRRRLSRIDRRSSTTLHFQNQLLALLELNVDRGDFLIEVGCFRGGLTAQLAHFAVENGKELYVVDVSPEYLEIARDTVAQVHGSDLACVHFVQDTLQGFLDQRRPSDRCLLVFIDGDHRYDGVVRDIKAAVGSRLRRPLSLCFHDYGLRYTDVGFLDVRVDRAIHDALPQCVATPIGEVAGCGGELPSAPTTDGGAHFPPGSSEGVVVVLEEKPPAFRSRIDPAHRRLVRFVKSTFPALHEAR